MIWSDERLIDALSDYWDDWDDTLLVAKKIRDEYEQHVATLKQDAVFSDRFRESYYELEQQVLALKQENERLLRDGEYSGPLEYYIPLVEKLEAEIDALKAENARLQSIVDEAYIYVEAVESLREQLEQQATQQWQPIENRAAVFTQGSYVLTVLRNGRVLLAYHRDVPDIRNVGMELPDDLRLCQRTPAVQVRP